MAALLVAFSSSSKRRSTEEEVHLLSRRIEQLRQVNDSLEEKLRWAEGRYARSMVLGKELNHALLQEKKRNTTLAEQLRERQQAAAGHPTSQTPDS